MSRDSLGELIGRVLRQAPFAMRQLAADAGLSYDVLRSWRSRRRRPSRSSAARLATGLEKRGELLLMLARELRTATDGHEGEGVGPDTSSMTGARTDGNTGVGMAGGTDGGSSGGRDGGSSGGRDGGVADRAGHHISG
ncbi:hypothetical protein BH23GEM9_BH23GEM9_21470 [soil metagenome]